MLSQKEAEILKLKKAIREGKKGINKLPGSMADRSGASLSAACLDNSDKAIIAQLRQEIRNLNEIIALQSHSEQGLSKKLQYLETTRSKGDVNYEYIKNVFLKYLIFKDSSGDEAERLKNLLLDLLNVTKQEKESINKTKDSKGFWNIFSSDTTKEDALTTLNSSYVIRPCSKSQMDLSLSDVSSPTESKNE